MSPMARFLSPHFQLSFLCREGRAGPWSGEPLGIGLVWTPCPSFVTKAWLWGDGFSPPPHCYRVRVGMRMGRPAHSSMTGVCQACEKRGRVSTPPACPPCSPAGPYLSHFGLLCGSRSGAGEGLPGDRWSLANTST